MIPVLAFPFEGLGPAAQVILTVALVTILLMLVWTAFLFVRGQRARVRAPEPDQSLADEFMWVFLVPALNEAVTIADSVARLQQVRVAKKRIVVIDDGSDDDTPSILSAISDPDLHVLRREPPEAREGKAAALNWAWRQLNAAALRDTPRSNVIVVIVDADGRLHPDAPSLVAAHFDEPQVGGVQSKVRIYNRRKLLAWCQDVEFGVYSALFQMGRNSWGTAGMGGNGQFNRLAALDSVADTNGPWRDKLTEDQDLGLRLIGEGWLGRQELRATVDQQGLSRLRPLLRQRTRWSQGNLQCIGLVGATLRAPRPLFARIEAVAYILMPLWQSIIGVAIVVALYLLITGQAPIIGDGNVFYQVLFFYLLGFGGVILGCIAAGAPRGWRGYITGFFVAQIYAFYSWLIWPVLVRSIFRQITDRRGWAKTGREPMDGDPGSGEEGAVDTDTLAA